jgi:hypothetical protein
VTATSDDTIAELRAEVSALRTERDAALAKRGSDFDERAAYQAATIDVLKAMSASPGDPQPVLELITRQAETLLDTPSAMLFEYDGKLVHIRAEIGNAELLGKDVMDAVFSTYPMAPHRGTLGLRALLDAEVKHVRDLAADPERSAELLALPYRSQISVPMLRDGRAIGFLSTASSRVNAFNDAQIELLKTFAEQAVLAIISAETHRALQERTVALAQRNSEYGERIEHQAATIDVLKEMSSSPGDAQPVFDLICQQAKALLGTVAVTLFEYIWCTFVRRMARTKISTRPPSRPTKALSPWSPIVAR